MDSSDTGPTLGASFFFGRIGAGHCDMDDIAFSPSSPSMFNPFSGFVRQTSTPASFKLTDHNPTGMSCESSERRFSTRRDSSTSTVSNYSTRRRLSSLIPSAHQSFDNLPQLMREKQTTEENNEFDNLYTQSLPATPLTTPGHSPPGSPKFDRAVRNQKLSVEDTRCSLPWYYPGFIAAHHPISEYASSLVCSSSDSQQQTPTLASTSTEVGTQEKLNGNHSGFSFLSTPQTSNGSGKIGQKKFSFTNRDMNFLAPTSM